LIEPFVGSTQSELTNKAENHANWQTKRFLLDVTSLRRKI
jgi:hypothetical protein